MCVQVCCGLTVLYIGVSVVLQAHSVDWALFVSVC